MRVGFDAKRAFNNFRGLGNYSRDTIRILAEQAPENDYFLFTPKVDSRINFPLSPSVQMVLPNHYLYQKLPSFWRTFAISRELSNHRLDLYHGLSHELPIGIERTAIRKVVTIHDLIFLKFPQLYPWVDRQMYKRKYLRSCAVADVIVAVSEQTKQDLVELAHVDERKIVVVYQGCNPIFYNKVTPSLAEAVREKYRLPAHYILNVGAIEARKNQKLIVEALSHSHTDIPLVIVGMKTDYLAELEELIAEHRLQHRVHILMHVSHDELPALYQSASLFIYPSLFEGFGIPILEALVSGVPVIAASGSCMEESGGPGSLYVSPYSAEELSVAIDKVLNDNTLRSEMLSHNAVHLVRFSDENIAREMMRIYKG